jgi:hypothetical protein
MASATVGRNFSTTARRIGQAGHETQRVGRRDILVDNSCEQFRRKYMRSRSISTTRTIFLRNPFFHGLSVCCGSDLLSS